MGSCFSSSGAADKPTDAPKKEEEKKAEEAQPTEEPAEAPTAAGEEPKADEEPADEEPTSGEEVIMCDKRWVPQVIGGGGATIKELKESTGANIDIGDSNEDPTKITITGDPAQVKAAKAKVEAIIKEAENPDYEGAEGKKWREEADHCAKMAEEAAKEKDALFDAGDKAGGHKKLDEVKDWQKKMHEANAKAADAIFENRNAGKGDRYMDFHGLRKKEAMDILEKKMEALKGQGGEVELIPGAGNHSAGAAVLKPAVIDYLKQNNFSFEEKNAGTLIVTL